MTLARRIGDAIDGARNSDGSPKTKAQIARECGVTDGAVSQWLSGATKNLKADTALALEQATGYRAYWIMYGKGGMKLTEPVFTWPFPKVPIERLQALDASDLGYVQRRLLTAVEECESTAMPVNTPQTGDESQGLKHQLVHARRETAADNDLTKRHAESQERKDGLDRTKALKGVFVDEVGGKAKHASRKPGGIQKPRTRRSA